MAEKAFDELANKGVETTGGENRAKEGAGSRSRLFDGHGHTLDSLKQLKILPDQQQIQPHIQIGCNVANIRELLPGFGGLAFNGRIR